MMIMYFYVCFSSWYMSRRLFSVCDTHTHRIFACTICALQTTFFLIYINKIYYLNNTFSLSRRTTHSGSFTMPYRENSEAKERERGKKSISIFLI